MAKKEIVDEEVVQAVTEGIVEQAKEDNKEVEEIVDEIIEESKEDNKETEESKEEVSEYTGDLRGFKTLADAKNYPETPEFKRLDKGCQTEYKDWLKSIM